MGIVKRRHVPYSKFKAFMSENRIKQHELALALGKSKSALNQNLNGTGGDFAMFEIRAICSMYDISADEYFVRPEVSNSKQYNSPNST